MFNNLKSVLINEDGATLVEYALVVSLIAVACILVISNLGKQIQTSFNAISTGLSKA